MVFHSYIEIRGFRLRIVGRPVWEALEPCILDTFSRETRAGENEE